FMFNTPPGTWPAMDLAKMTAKIELIERLHDDTFTSFREVRPGIAHFSPIPTVAQGQLASSVTISLAIKPHILHVVGFSEGDHATHPEELIHSCNIVHGVLHNCLRGLPDMVATEAVQRRKIELTEEATVLLEAIQRFGADRSEDPWSDPHVLAAAIKQGLLDTPHFRGHPHLCGEITTRLIDGAWYAVDEAGNVLGEKTRTQSILAREGKMHSRK
ncbi:MAG: methionine synthase, partial [Bacteroidota bacterium]